MESSVVYDMYHWDRAVPAAENGGHTNPAGNPAVRRAAANGAAKAARSAGRPPAAHAVQVALDRRDNGGDSRTSRDS
jgi:hypothetical protein